MEYFQKKCPWEGEGSWENFQNGGKTMVRLDKIREDLREVRYYYTRKELFDETFKSISTNVILEKVYRYNEAIRSAPVRLYDLYVCLYTKNYTQAALALELDYTTEYIQMLHKKLLLFLQTKICG